MDFEFEIKNEFLLEAKELLEQAEESFLEFEKNPSEIENIDSIFRIFHTLKGSSFTAGFEDFGKFTHKIENLLTYLKAGKFIADSACCDYLLNSNDVLKDWVALLESNLDAVYSSANADDILEYIDSLNLSKSDESQKIVTPSFGFFDDDEPPSSYHQSSDFHHEKNSNIVKMRKENSEHPHILIVDDEQDIQDLLEMYVEELDAKVSKASDGEEGLRIVKENSLDIILSDLRMPNMDGIEFIQKVRQFNKFIPVLFISGAADREDIISFINLGAYGFIEKPMSRELLLTQVRSGLYIKQMRENISMMTMLNFQIYMISHQLFRSKDETKKQILQNQLKAKLDQISELNNKILEIKMLEIA